MPRCIGLQEWCVPEKIRISYSGECSFQPARIRGLQTPTPSQLLKVVRRHLIELGFQREDIFFLMRLFIFRLRQSRIRPWRSLTHWHPWKKRMPKFRIILKILPGIRKDSVTEKDIFILMRTEIIGLRSSIFPMR